MSVSRRTAVHWASQNGHSPVVKKLIAAGANVTAQTKDGRTALHWASNDGHSKVVKELIAAGANVFAQTTDGWTALYVASYNGHSLVVKELTSAGADVRVRDSAGRTAVHWASNNGHSEVVKELIAAGANVDVQTKGGSTALHRASYNGHSEVVKELIAAGANVHVQDKDGWTSLHDASQNGHSEVVRKLIAAGVNVHVQSKGGDTALHFAAGSDDDVHWEPVEFVIADSAVIHVQEGGRKAQAKEEVDRTALHKTSQKGHSKVIKELIAAGADVHVLDISGWTALHRASYKGLLEVVKELIAAGADVHVQHKDGRTALHRASHNGHLQVVKELISAGADISMKDIFGMTAAMYAKDFGHRNVVKELDIATIPQRTGYVAPAASRLQDAEGRNVSPLASGRQGSAHGAPVASAPPRTWISTNAVSSAQSVPEITEPPTSLSGQVPPGPDWTWHSAPHGTQETEVAPAPSAPLRLVSAQAVPEDAGVPNTFADQKPCLCPEYQREMFTVDTTDSGLLASGAFGAVYRGRIGEQSVAVKVIGGGRNDVVRKEVAILHMIDDPHVSRIYGWHCDGTQTFLLLELLAESLEQRLKRAKKGASTTASRRPFLSWAEYYSICLGVLHGVGALHKHRCLHRDIKPQNIMLSSEGVAKLVDLGISKEKAAMTATGTQAGTFPYMAPEVQNNHRYSFPADMYSVGCTAWQLINGRTPWEWVTLLGFLAQHQAGLPMDSIQATPTIAPGLVELIASMLKYNPGDRCTNADAITKCQQLRKQYV
ncbi:hypothetical protein DIPPA_11962 [Diplonema papillatum]|nr:hypothetical protein DIPPA_11962 [Diplonema papillatum]